MRLLIQFRQDKVANHIIIFKGVSYPNPQGVSVDYPMPQSEQKKQQIPINFFWAICGKNLQ